MNNDRYFYNNFAWSKSKYIIPILDTDDKIAVKIKNQMNKDLLICEILVKTSRYGEYKPFEYLSIPFFGRVALKTNQIRMKNFYFKELKYS